MRVVGRHGPHELHALFAAAINAKDVDRVVALYESGAAMVIEPGRVLTDARDLRSAVARFIARASWIKVETIGVLEAQGLALLRSEWTRPGASSVHGASK